MALMNRFRKEEISAANVNFAVPPTPFSWSVSRHLLFHHCRRAYFLHYYLAQGGWDPYADPLLRFVWSAKKYKTYSERLERSTEEILRFSFDTLRNVPPSFRLRMLAVRFQARIAALKEDWSSNENEHSFDFGKALSDLKSALAAFLDSETCSAIVSAQNLTLFNKAFKPSFFFNGTEVWYNPGLIWRENNQLTSLRIHFSKPSLEFIRAESDIFALSAWEHTRTEQTLSLYRYFSDGEWKEMQWKGDCSSGVDRLHEDTRAMQELISGETVNLFDFPPESDERCLTCRFSAVCAAIMEQFGDV